MEQNKHLEPKFSISFSHISDVLLQNYKESSSMTSSIIGGHSQISSSLMKQSQTGYQVSNNLVERVNSQSKERGDSAKFSQSSDEPSRASSGLTIQQLKKHNIIQTKQNKYNIKNKQEEIKEEVEDENEKEEALDATFNALAGVKGNSSKSKGTKESKQQLVQRRKTHEMINSINRSYEFESDIEIPKNNINDDGDKRSKHSAYTQSMINLQNVNTQGILKNKGSRQQ